jgi:hypothetical protein
MQMASAWSNRRLLAAAFRPHCNTSANRTAHDFMSKLHEQPASTDHDWMTPILSVPDSKLPGSSSFEEEAFRSSVHFGLSSFCEVTRSRHKHQPHLKADGGSTFQSRKNPCLVYDRLMFAGCAVARASHSINTHGF